jgi:acetylglutamate kinase
VNAGVVKIGGAALADRGWLAGFAASAAQAGRPLVIVHGGGPEITSLCDRLDVPVSWSNGRRVTSPEALDIASMVLTGRLNKRLVGALMDAGVDTIGLSGEDGGVVRGRLAAEGALGRVGVVTAVRSELLRRLLDAGTSVVLSPISRGEDGAPLNINADEVAAAVAAALGADALLFVTDVAGVSDGVVTRASLTESEARGLIADGTASGGMAVKLDAALTALGAGVRQVRIGTHALLHDAAAGTTVQGLLEVAA